MYHFLDPRLFLVNNLQLDDGASSTASFDDVGGNSTEDLSGHKELIILDPRFKTKGNTMGNKVPDVKYVLQYKSLTGQVVECKCMLHSTVKRYSS